MEKVVSKIAALGVPGLILFRECLRNKIIPVVIEDVNRNEYLDALKEYREEESLDKMIRLFEKEQQFYLEKCKYFMQE